MGGRQKGRYLSSRPHPDPAWEGDRPRSPGYHSTQIVFASRNTAVSLVPRSFSVGGNGRPPITMHVHLVFS